MVFGVLGEVAVRPSLLDVPDVLGALDGLDPLQLLLETQDPP